MLRRSTKGSFAALLTLAFVPIVSAAGTSPTYVYPIFGIDDWNQANLNPSPSIPVSTIGQCPWINTGLDNFEATHAGWSHVWASQAEQQKVEAGLAINDYFAWVVKEPVNLYTSNGQFWTTPDPPLVGNNNVHDVGGAVMNLTYNPANAAPGAHVFNDLHWVQGLYAYYDIYGAYTPGNFQTRLDNPFNPNSPFYDKLGNAPGGAAGKLDGGGGWFLDTPFKIEDDSLPEPPDHNPVADVQFQVVLADYDSTNKIVTLYGGVWWGYQYNAFDTPVPEPATLGLLILAPVGLMMRRRSP